MMRCNLDDVASSEAWEAVASSQPATVGLDIYGVEKNEARV